MRVGGSTSSSYGADWRDDVNPLLDGWTDARIRDATSFIWGRVIGDVATAGLVGVGELLRFRVEDGEVLATAFGGEDDFPIELHEGVESACAVTAGQLQDGVVDRLHRPWPELVDGEGRFVGVLEAGEADQTGGIACWALRGVPFCAVGQLSAAIPAAGLWLAQGAAGRAVR
jgi:hypothetical protein